MVATLVWVLKKLGHHDFFVTFTFMMLIVIGPWSIMRPIVMRPLMRMIRKEMMKNIGEYKIG